MGGAKDNQCDVVRAQCNEPRVVFIVLLGREEAVPLGFPIYFTLDKIRNAKTTNPMITSQANLLLVIGPLIK